MGRPQSEKTVLPQVDQILGYLNFSAGNHDPTFIGNLNQVFEHYTDSQRLWEEVLESRCRTVPRHKNSQPTEDPGQRGSLKNLLRNDGEDRSRCQLIRPDGITPAFAAVHQALVTRLESLGDQNETFRDSRQASSVIAFVFEQFLPAYLRHHRDLLFHQNTEIIFNSFFVARLFEAALSFSWPTDESDGRVREMLKTINDHIGHRPVATLESREIEPYSHEYIRPVPVYIRDVSVAAGPYQELIQEAIEIIKATPESILTSARFDPSKLDELAIDSRAFDFDHPVNKRPNHHFGTWDEQQIGPDGFFRRFIIHQVMLDCLLWRIKEVAESDEGMSPPASEIKTEAAAVLACTILMASAISGGAVGGWDSTTSLSDLMPLIAGYRDEFYEVLLMRLPPAHRKRLEAEIKTRHQPFGAARQHLNMKLAKQRASQLVNCRLASIFARMGYPDAANMQLEIVPVAAARIICQVDCLLSAATESISSGELEDALESVPHMMTLLKRGIRCGAIVDPWNIIGFDANYSLFPALENSVRDHRAFDLVDLVESIMALCSRLWREAAAEDRPDLSDQIRSQFLAIVDWWRKYAAFEVMGIDAVDPLEIFEAAQLVATALNLWQKGGAETGDIAFWSKHAELFDSPQAYSLVIDALMQRKDYRTTTALMIHWISQADTIGLQQGESSFHNLLFRWISEQKTSLTPGNGAAAEPSVETAEATWKQIRRFHDYLEANAEDYWEVPLFELQSYAVDDGEFDGDEDDDRESGSDGDRDVYSAAYDEGFVYQDSTADGFDGEIFDDDMATDDEIEAEVDRLLDRMEFLGTLASFWRIAATIPLAVDRGANDATDIPEPLTQRLQQRRETALLWLSQAQSNQQKLLQLLASIDKYRLPETDGDQESLLNYDQHRVYKESLLDVGIHTSVETENAIRALRAVAQAVAVLLDDPQTSPDDTTDAASPLTHVTAGFLLKDPLYIGDHFPDLISGLEKQPILYVPLARGGAPEKIVDARAAQTALMDLLQTLPTMGMFTETWQLTRTALLMERENPVALGAVSEFDELLKVAYTSMVRTLVQSTERYHGLLSTDDTRTEQDVAEQSESVLFDCVEMLTESMLILWLDHSRTLRLSVLERVLDKDPWQRLVKFIKGYGRDLLVQNFLHPGNVRAILHQGVEHWIDQMETNSLGDELPLFQALGKQLERKEAVFQMSQILESVLENFNEYRDYNTTTSQSDHGELLYQFLDFLRLRTRYDRVCWNLKPVVWAHRILVKQNHGSVARMWRRSLNDKIGHEADRYAKQFDELKKKYSIELQSVARRIEGRFGSRMQIDRLISQVRPAMRNPRSAETWKAFDKLQSEAQKFTQTTMGVGIDLPEWLAAMEDEVQQVHLPARLKTWQEALHWLSPEVSLIAELREQLEQLPRRS